MALAFGTYGATEPTNAKTITISIPIAISPATLVVGPSAYDSTNGTNTLITSITHNGTSLTQLEADEFGGAGDGASSYLYSKGNRGVGTSNLVVTYAGTCSNPTVHWITYTDSDPGEDFDAHSKCSNSAVTTQSGTVTTVSDNALVWSWIGFSNNGGGTENGADQTETGNTEGGFVVSSKSNTAKTPAGAVIHTYGNGVSDSSTVFMVAVAPQVVAGAVTTNARRSLLGVGL